jgi:valyl-tRNA synthetase
VSYTYDNRPKKAASKEEQAETLENLIGLLSDAITPAEAIVSALEKDTDTDFYDARKYAKEVLDCISTAEGVEVIADYIGNIREAKTQLGLLEAELKKVKQVAKKDKDSVALEAVEEALDELTGLKRELRDIGVEIEDAAT